MNQDLIAEAGKENYQELITVWENSVRATHDFLSESDILSYRGLILNEYFDQVKLYCIKEKQEILGFIGINDEAIQMLFIHADARGKGLGKKLIDFVKKKHGVNAVDVNEQNSQAVGFYEKLGFVTVERSEFDDAGKPYPILSMELKN